MTEKPEPIADLGVFAFVETHMDVPVGEIWMGPADSDQSKIFGPGTTEGGRAEAGWFKVASGFDGSAI